MLRIRSAFLMGATSAMLFALPMSMRAQAAPALVTCMDLWMSAGGKGACSGHGGVDKKATKAATKAAAAAKAPKPVTITKAAPAPSAAAMKPAPVAVAPVAAPPKSVAPKAAPMAAPMAAPKAAPKAVAPATASKDGPPTAKCKDGSMSYAKGHAGACSRHGGVAEWLDGTAKKP